jgi:hypothetical protein
MGDDLLEGLAVVDKEALEGRHGPWSTQIANGPLAFCADPGLEATSGVLEATPGGPEVDPGVPETNPAQGGRCSRDRSTWHGRDMSNSSNLLYGPLEASRFGGAARRRTSQACGSSDVVGLDYVNRSIVGDEEVSEYECSECGARVGRWSGRLLEDDEFEPQSTRGW